MICPVTGTRCESTGCTAYIDGRCNLQHHGLPRERFLKTPDGRLVFQRIERVDTSGVTMGISVYEPAAPVDSSGTPRVDAVIANLASERSYSFKLACIGTLARTLERELDSATRACSILSKDLFNLTEKVLPNVRERADIADKVSE